MQTTLLGLAIAIILALVAALVGPLLIDWGGYRSVFETEASRLIGVDVRVTGAIEARLLPSPQLTLHDIEIGRGEDKIGAHSLGIEFALGPLMRGEWHAAELHLAGPQLRLGLDAEGRIAGAEYRHQFQPGCAVDRPAEHRGRHSHSRRRSQRRRHQAGQALVQRRGALAASVRSAARARRRSAANSIRFAFPPAGRRRRRAQAASQYRSGQSSVQHCSRTDCLRLPAGEPPSTAH